MHPKYSMFVLDYRKGVSVSKLKQSKCHQAALTIEPGLRQIPLHDTIFYAFLSSLSPMEINLYIIWLQFLLCIVYVALCDVNQPWHLIE